jgi:hypothetical protein
VGGASVFGTRIVIWEESASVDQDIGPFTPMSQSHRCPVYVDFLTVKVQVALKLFGNHGKSFIDLPDIDVIDGKTRLC